MELGYEEPHVCGLGATIGVKPTCIPTTWPNAPLSTTPILGRNIRHIGYPPLAP